MIDTHCHINFDAFDDDREQILKKSKEKLTAIINSGTSIETNQQVLKLANENSNFLYPTFGFHPIESGKTDEQSLNKVINLITEHLNEIVAIGEVGMDYFYIKDKKEREKQGEIFKKFASLANENEIPLVIHARDCEKKAYNIVKEFKDIPHTIFHCYSGSLKTAKKLIDNGYYISFSTMICYSHNHQELVKEIPLENILTETDSPYLAPERGNRNEPINVAKVIEKIAELKEENISSIDKITENTAKSVFGIK
ncbi:putative deoxyribonuclease YjjV [Methanobrevibacter cuticularis]|uniref:Putative deoxyribonuclease YjjV n=1 Tax=Methanobrevibacter cuticularis TaxID=47311 RepID=A0A166D8P8_9EURY|nr:TatD family hydrolase [Methanobrevibacter cuticularis]KZX15324.1 putative deoxyribonuclease YjjV [Methanobrevibacter cuticularis]